MNITYCVSVCVCSHSYQACNAHASDCHLWPASPYNIFTHCRIKGTIYAKKVTELKMCVLISSATFVRNISQSKKKSARYHECN